MYRCHSLMTSKDVSTFKSLEGWRRSNSSRQSFKQSLSFVASTSTFVDGSILPTPRQLTYSEPRVSRNKVRLIHQGTQESTSYTPERNVLKLYEGNQVTDHIRNRWINCKGNILCRVSLDGNNVSLDGAGARGRCVMCKAMTHFFCRDCHHWLCGPGEEYDDGSGKP